MQWQYAYTGYIWVPLGSAVLFVVLGIYTWRHRTVPGATALVFVTAVGVVWFPFGALAMAAADPLTKLFWARAGLSIGVLGIVATFCFVLEYAGLAKWITRRTLTLLVVPPLAFALLNFTNEVQFPAWAAVGLSQGQAAALGPISWLITGYVYLLFLISTFVLIRLFVRSPLHRWPVAIILAGQLAPRVGFAADILGSNLLSPLDPTMMFATLTTVAYAVALFRFRLFDVVPVARETVLERMVDGILVLDAEGRVADLNPAAQALLGTSRSRVLGRDGALALAAFPDLARLAFDHGQSQVDAMLGTSATQRWYQVSSSPLTDRRGFQLGRLMLFHDLTELKRAQQRMLEQQRALATLEERERIARELHDGLGQVLGYVKLQAQAARELLSRDPSTAEAYLDQLVAVAQDAHADVREYILGAGSGSPAGSGFLASLERYLGRYRQHYGIAADLRVQPGLDDEAFAPTVAVQLLRIVQEALNNVRKHARASQVRVELAVEGGAARVLVADDGVGFDPARAPVEGRSFGLRFMRERAEQVGGSVEVDSAPGKGTRVVVRVPRRVLAAAQEWSGDDRTAGGD